MKLLASVKSQKRDLLILSIWIAIMALIMIKAHYILHSTNPRFVHEREAFIDYQPPSLETADVFILAAVSIIVVMLLTDVKSLIFGYFASIGIAFTVSIIYATIYIWYILDYQSTLSLVPFGWEAALYMAFVSMIWVMFPYVLGITILGAVLGVFLRQWLVSS